MTNETKKPKVVVVDDEPDFLKLVSSWLRPSYEVVCLTGAEGACEEIAALEPDAVVLDVHMPDKSGFAVCRELRAKPGGADLPIVFLTGSKTDEDFLQHLETGGSRYLTKPIGRQALLEALAEQLGGTPAG
ncbi:MAG: response regulator [Elusimicrobia bacterium]|nr:response regulator [Elusimicrobiota bacterium]